MDIRFIVIIAAVLLMLITMGRNPADEMRQKREERRQGRDDLIISIEEHNSKKNGASMIGNRQSNNPYQGYQSNRQPTFGKPIQGGSESPYSTHTIQNLPQEQAPPQSTYYPPTPKPPESKYHKPVQPSEAVRNSPATVYDPKAYPSLPANVIFAGANVYTVDQYGNQIPVPDGAYNYQGRTIIEIKDGKQVFR